MKKIHLGKDAVGEFCFSCQNQIIFKKDGLWVETGEHKYLFCRQCLKEAMQTLMRKEPKTPEEVSLFSQIRKYLKERTN